MAKPIVFISHISEEQDIAMEFKKLVENSFLGMIDVFVSSDNGSIGMGQKWLDNITHALKTCVIEIILCSPKSVARPWINFEAGAGWIKDIPVIPLCHSGMTPAMLPVPLSLLQAGIANEISSMKLIFPLLANAIGAKSPTVDFSDFVEKVKSFEETYTFWDVVNEEFKILHDFHPDLISVLKKMMPVKMELTETQINILSSEIKFLYSNAIIQFSPRTGGTAMGPAGVFYGCTLLPLVKFKTIMNDPKFDFK